MKKVLILGADSTVGHILALYLKEFKEYNVTTICFKKRIFDDCFLLLIKDRVEIKNLLVPSYDIVINCIKIDEYFTHPSFKERLLINYVIPKLLHNTYRKSETRLIGIYVNNIMNHALTTDCNCKKRKTNKFYNLTKDTIISSNIIGPSLITENRLFDTFTKSKNQSYVYYNENCYAINSLTFVQKVKEIMDEYLFGIYKIKSSNGVSKYELLMLLKNSFFKRIEIQESTLNVDLDYDDDSNVIFVNNKLEQFYELRRFMKYYLYIYNDYFDLKNRLIIIKSYIAGNFESNEEDYKIWLEKQLNTIIKYNVNALKRQTNQEFKHLIICDSFRHKLISDMLCSIDYIPANITITVDEKNSIVKEAKNYAWVYIMNLKEGVILERTYIQRLFEYTPRRNTLFLVTRGAFIYDLERNELSKWEDSNASIYIVIYDSEEYEYDALYINQNKLNDVELDYEIVNNIKYLLINNHNNGKISDEVFKETIIKDIEYKNYILEQFGVSINKNI